MAFTPKECAVLIEPPSEEILATDARIHHLGISSNIVQDLTTLQLSIRTLGKWYTTATQNANGKWDIYGKLDLDADCKTLGTRLDTHKTCDQVFLTGSCVLNAGSGLNIDLLIGLDRELVVGDKKQLLTLPHVFDATFQNPGTENKHIRDVLKMTDNIQLSPFVSKYHHFLLHQQPGCPGDTDYLCTLQETAPPDQPQCRQEDRQCLALVLSPSPGSQVLPTPCIVSQLCCHCLQDISQSHHPVRMDEVLGRNNTILICRPTTSCCGRNPVGEEECSTAGELVLCWIPPGPILTHFLGVSSSSCEFAEHPPPSFLLDSPPLSLPRREKVDDVVGEEESLLPATGVPEKRRRIASEEARRRGVSRKQRAKRILWVVLIILILLFAFLLQYVLVRFLVAPFVRNMQAADTSAERAINQTYDS